MTKSIIVIEDSSKSRFGGGQKVSLKIIEILSKRYKVILIDCKKPSIFNIDAREYVSRFLGLKCYGYIKKGERSAFSLSYLEIIIFPILSIYNILLTLKFLKRESLNKNNSILYATTKKALFHAYFIHKILNIKYVYHSHSVIYKDYFLSKPIINILRKAIKIICVSNYILNNIQLANCSVIYNPVDSHNILQCKTLNKSKVVIATFSSLISLKGIEYFMQSFNFLKNSNNVTYEIYGTGPEEEYLKQFENKHVKLMGFTDQAEEIINTKIDVLIVPSITAEACPMTPLEAFSSGVPVISTNIGGQAEIVIDNYNGFHVQIKNPNEIAQKIDFLIDNPLVFSKLSNNAMEFSEKFDIKIFENKILDVFNNCFYVKNRS